MNLPGTGMGLHEAIARARAFSPFLSLQLERFPEVREALETGDAEGALAAARVAGAGEPIGAAIRRERAAVSLALAIPDLAGALPLERLVAELSDLADRSISAALGAAFAERDPGEPGRGFAILALGKLGSRELNFSSDVDLLFLYEPGALPYRPREEPAQAALRIAQRVVSLLQERTEEGFAFRVDLRLRPSSEVTPLALPVDAAISHYESSALPWERAAFIRARLIAGDAALGDYFLVAVQPFVWRRTLDFGATAEIQAISRRIRDHYHLGQAFGPGFDLKRGRGGIREVEFYVQIQQLIHGGRDPALRAPSILDAIPALGAAGLLEPRDAEALTSAYRLFRTVEHRLQMVEDRQTHRLPVDLERLADVARLHGLEGGGALLDLLAPAVARIAALYDLLSPEAGARLPLDPASLEHWLSGLGLDDAVGARRHVERWRSGAIRALRSPAARDAFEAMLPDFLETLARAPDPPAAIARFEVLLSRLTSGVNLFRLIEARPALGRHLSALLSHAPALAEQLGRRPELIDGLLDASAFDPAPGVDALIADFSGGEGAGADYQASLDRVRRRVNERRFALGVQSISGTTDPLDVAEGNSRVAEAAIRVLAAAAIGDFEQAHGKVPGSELLILGLGRLGGEALTFASDLDLIYLFSGDVDRVSDGARPLRATDYFNRLAPRVTAALSVATAAGPLYEVDTRLRPHGTDGMLAQSLGSFAQYQAETAWTWEHMALLRARPLVGSPAPQEDLRKIIDEVLRRPREPKALLADVVRMRGEIARHKPPVGPLDVKHLPGGLVDLEFSVHALQLAHHVGLDPHLERAIAALDEAGLVPVAAEEVDGALRLMTRLLVMLRLISPAGADAPPATRALLAERCGRADWEDLLAGLAGARLCVSRLWAAVTGEESEC